VGLFGTVLGIIKAFNDLALTGQSGVSVVMSGISGALIATAFGILVAIPAVVANNTSSPAFARFRPTQTAFRASFCLPERREELNMQSGSDDNDLVTGINVTPLVDITLVLLIISW